MDAVTGLGMPDFGRLLRLSTPWILNDGGVVDPAWGMVILSPSVSNHSFSRFGLYSEISSASVDKA